MFLVNSRLASFAAARLATGRPYPEVTAISLPSSFTRVLPYTLAHLCPPTCVGLRYGFFKVSARHLFSTPRQRESDSPCGFTSSPSAPHPVRSYGGQVLAFFGLKPKSCEPVLRSSLRSKERSGMTSHLNVLTLARHQPLYISFRFSRDLCFC